MEIRGTLSKDLFEMFAKGESPLNYDNIGGIFYGSDPEHNIIISQFLFKIKEVLNNILEILRKFQSKELKSQLKELLSKYHEELSSLYEDFDAYIKKKKIDQKRYKGKIEGIKLINLPITDIAREELPRFRNKKGDGVIDIHFAELVKNVRHGADEKKDLDVLVFIKLSSLIGKELNYGEAVKKLNQLTEGKLSLVKIIVRTYLVEKLLETVSETVTNSSQMEEMEKVKKYSQGLYNFLSKCLNELNGMLPEGKLKETASIIEFIQDKIFPLSVKFEEDVVYIEKIGLSEKKYTVEEALKRVDEKISKDETFSKRLIENIEKEAGITIKELLGYTRVNEGERTDQRNIFLIELGELVKKTIFRINSNTFFFLTYGDKKYKMSYGVYKVPSTVTVIFFYEDNFFKNKEDKEKLYDAFKKGEGNYSAPAFEEMKFGEIKKIEPYFFNLKYALGDDLYNNIKENLLNQNASGVVNKVGVLALFFALVMTSLSSLSYEYTIKSKDRLYSFVFCLENDNYPIWDFVRYMYGKLGTSVQTITPNLLYNENFPRSAAIIKNTLISLFKDTKTFVTVIEKLQGEIPKDYLNVVFVVEQSYLKMFTNRNYLNSLNSELQNNAGINHSTFHLYNVILKKDKKKLHIYVSADIPVPYLHFDPSESLDVLKSKIYSIIQNDNESDKGVIAFIGSEDGYIKDVKANLEKDNNFKTSFVSLDYFVFPVLSFAAFKSRNKGYILNYDVVKKIFENSGFKRFNHLSEIIGIKPIKAIGKENVEGKQFLQSSNLHMFGFREQLSFEIKEMFIYALLGLAGYFSESSHYAYRSFDFSRKSGEKYIVTRNGFSYRISLFAIIPELLYQQQKNLSHFMKERF